MPAGQPRGLRTGRGLGPLGRLAMVALALFGGALPVAGQARSVPGRVLVGQAPADSGTVVLHRVSPGFAGEVDSLAIGPGGRFELPLPTDADSAVFFASVRVDGVLYFGSAIHDPADLDSLYTVQAYPGRVMAPGGVLPVRVRNLFVESDDSGWTVTDLFEVLNNTAFTVIAGAGGDTWSHALPEGATDFRVGQSDLTPDRTSLVDGRIRTSTPVVPGESIYLVQYRVPSGALAIPSESATERFELLFREPGPEVAVDGLAAIEPVEVDGTTYRRFAGNNLAPTVVRAEPGSRREWADTIPWLAAGLTLLLAALGGWVALRSTGTMNRGEVLLQVARLDEDMAAGRIEREAYEQRRRRLLDAIPRERP